MWRKAIGSRCSVLHLVPQVFDSTTFCVFLLTENVAHLHYSQLTAYFQEVGHVYEFAQDSRSQKAGSDCEG